MTSTVAASIASAASLELLPAPLSKDVLRSLSKGLQHGAVFSSGSDPETIFRHSVFQVVAARCELLRRFLIDGPYEEDGPVPAPMRRSRLADQECARAITFVFSHVVNAFQGRLAELLSVGPCTSLFIELQKRGLLSSDARLYMGDAVRSTRLTSSGMAKGADFYLLNQPCPSRLVVEGVGEVKSYCCSQKRLDRQLRHHIRRATRGLALLSRHFSEEEITLGGGTTDEVPTIGVVPASWRLSRRFSFRTVNDRTFLESEPSIPLRRNSRRKLSGNTWRIVLRWSKEALACAAYDLSGWYMENLGEHVFGGGQPSPWPEMTPAEAGRNATKMMLYYAILRCRTPRDEQRAIALYNSYGFGYALGLSFRDRCGRRAMLWPEDLRELLVSRETKYGDRLSQRAT